MRKAQPEYDLQVAIASYLRTQYPQVDFMSDTIAAVKLHCPDLLIFESRRGFHGCFLELKASTPYEQNGELKKDAHLANQAATIQRLQQKGFYAGFVWDFDQAREMLDWYLEIVRGVLRRTTPEKEAM